MDNALKLHLINALFRIRKVGLLLPSPFHISMRELMCLYKITENKTESDKTFPVSDIHTQLHVSKPAFSQMLNALENKGLVKRNINLNDRRKITVTLTDKGSDLMRHMDRYIDVALEDIITQMGVEDTRQLISLLSRLIDILQTQNSNSVSEGGSSH